MKYFNPKGGRRSGKRTPTGHDGQAETAVAATAQTVGSGEEADASSAAEFAAENELGSEAARQLAIRSRISTLLAESGPTIALQPIIHLETGELIAHEAAVTFPSAPDTRQWFVDAEQVGLGVELEIAALRSALNEVDHTPGSSLICVNVSPDFLTDRKRLDLIAEFPSQRLVLEITGDLPVEDHGLVRQELSRIRARGVRIAVNVAGSDASCLRRIRDLEPEFVKLQVDVTTSLSRDENCRAIVTEIVRLATLSGSFVVAEGIESSEQVSVAQQLRVDAGQGFLLGMPTSAELGEFV